MQNPEKIYSGSCVIRVRHTAFIARDNAGAQISNSLVVAGKQCVTLKPILAFLALSQYTIK